VAIVRRYRDLDPEEDLPTYGGVRTWWEGTEEDLGLVEEGHKSVSPTFRGEETGKTEVPYRCVSITVEESAVQKGVFCRIFSA
jgi:hypothetical protein